MTSAERDLVLTHLSLSIRAEAEAENDPHYAVDEYLHFIALLYARLSAAGPHQVGTSRDYAAALRELAQRIDYQHQASCVRHTR